MQLLIRKSYPLYGIKSVEIFHPYPETPKIYLLNIDGELFSYRIIANLVFISGEDLVNFNAEMIGIIRNLIRKAQNYGRRI